MTLINHNMPILSTAGKNYVRTTTGFLSTECNSDSHEEEVREITVLLIYIYIY
jgi:hypothetical protein